MFLTNHSIRSALFFFSFSSFRILLLLCLFISFFSIFLSQVRFAKKKEGHEKEVILTRAIHATMHGGGPTAVIRGLDTKYVHKTFLSFSPARVLVCFQLIFIMFFILLSMVTLSSCCIELKKFNILDCRGK